MHGNPFQAPRRALGLALFALVAAFGAAACGEGAGPGDPAPDAELRQELAAANVTPLQAPPAQDPAMVSLGRALTFDKILSGNRNMSCATCHNPATGTSDSRSISLANGGRGFIARNASDLFNHRGSASTALFWDGRVERDFDGSLRTPAGAALPAGLSGPLAAQALFPMATRNEMRGQAGDLDRDGNPNEIAAGADGDFTGVWSGLMRRVLAVQEYVALFQAAYPGIPADSLGIQHAANAIAAFTVTAYSRADSPFDRFLAGDGEALSVQEKRGALLFFGRAGCAACHNGPLLSNNTFANIGTPQVGPGFGAEAPNDHGREGVTGAAGDRYRFRVPPLRNVELSAPYMHDGAFTTLEAAVRHYLDVPASLRGYDPSQLEPALRGTVRRDQVDPILATLDQRVRQPLDLDDADVADLVAFLRSLTDPSARDLSAEVPARVPSGIPAGE